MFYSLPHFSQKWFCILAIWLLVCPHAIFPYLMVEIVSLFWNVQFCLWCFIQSQYFFSLLSFAHPFDFFPRILLLVLLVLLFLFAPNCSSVFTLSYDFFVLLLVVVAVIEVIEVVVVYSLWGFFFTISSRRWFAGVWVTPSLLWYQGHFLVLLSILEMLWYRRFNFCLKFPVYYYQYYLLL